MHDDKIMTLILIDFNVTKKLKSTLLSDKEHHLIKKINSSICMTKVHLVQEFHHKN